MFERYNQAFYYDFDNREELRSYLEEMEGNYFKVGIETSNSLLEGIDSIIDAAEYKREKIKKRSSYMEMSLKKEGFIDNKVLMDFLIMLAEIDDFVFIAADPVADEELFNLEERKVVINATAARSYTIFNYEVDSLIVFE